MKLSRRRETKKAIKQLDAGVLTAVEALVRALSELDVDSKTRKRTVKREIPATETEGKQTVTEEESESYYEKGKTDVSSLRTLVGVLAELRSMLLSETEEKSGGIIILPSRLAVDDNEKEEDLSKT